MTVSGAGVARWWSAGLARRGIGFESHYVVYLRATVVAVDYYDARDACRDLLTGFALKPVLQRGGGFG